MTEQFFAQPILNSPYTCPARHWELDANGQPTQQIIPSRRRADFVTPIPKPRKRKGEQIDLLFDEGKGLSTKDQAYSQSGRFVKHAMSAIAYPGNATNNIEF